MNNTSDIRNILNGVDYTRILAEKLEKMANKHEERIEFLLKIVTNISGKIDTLIKEKQTLKNTDDLKDSLDELNKHMSTHQTQNIKTLNDSIDSLTKEFSKIKLSTPGTEKLVPRTHSKTFLVYDVENYKKKTNLEKEK